MMKRRSDGVTQRRRATGLWSPAIHAAQAKRSDRSHARVARRALTLVELMVVVVILGILATTVTISVRDYLISGKQNAAKQELAQLTAALELFYLESDRYPTNQEGLEILRAKSEKHPDGLLRGGDLNDPWGHPYQYVYPGLHGTFDVVCYGADGQEGGSGADADLNSWDLK